jgi:hypothetical protein
MNLWDKFWKDDRGHYVVWQMPNAYLIAWAVLTIVALATNGRMSDIFAGAGDVLLFVWSGLEIFKGASFFRRVIGLAVLIYAVLSFLKIF